MFNGNLVVVLHHTNNKINDYASNWMKINFNSVTDAGTTLNIEWYKRGVGGNKKEQTSFLELDRTDISLFVWV